MRRPVNSPYRITLGYGATTSPYSPSSPHNGVDYVSTDRQIISAHSGKVTFAGWLNNRSGNMVAVEGGGYRITYSHIKHGGFKVSVGQNVSEGQHIADMGMTGFASGIHVHVVVNSGSLNLEDLITEGDNVITKDDVAPVRVVMSEVEGWDGHEIHAGKHDAQIMGWAGKTWPEFVMHGWNVQQTKRHDLTAQVNELTKVIKIKDNEIAALKAQVGEATKWQTLKALLRELIGKE